MGIVNESDTNSARVGAWRKSTEPNIQDIKSGRTRNILNVSRMIDKGLITKDDSEKLAPELTNFTRQNSDEKHTKSDVKITSLL